MSYFLNNKNNHTVIYINTVIEKCDIISLLLHIYSHIIFIYLCKKVVLITLHKFNNNYHHLRCILIASSVLHCYYYSLITEISQ